MQANLYLFNNLRPIPAQTSFYIVMHIDLEAMNFLNYKRCPIKGVLVKRAHRNATTRCAKIDSCTEFHIHFANEFYRKKAADTPPSTGI